MLKRIIILLTLYSTIVHAGHLNVLLVDDREDLISSAQFFYRILELDYFRSFKVESFSKKRRIGNYSNGFNHRMGMSGGYPPSVYEMKVVAPGYEVFTWMQTWPNDEDFKTVRLRKLRSHVQDEHQSQNNNYYSSNTNTSSSNSQWLDR